MRTITTVDTFGVAKTYEIVNKIPNGFFVWNIGKNMGDDEWIPLAEWYNKDDYTINPNTVKAIKVGTEYAKLLDKGASWGINNLENARRVMNDKRMRVSKRRLAQTLVPIFEEIS